MKSTEFLVEAEANLAQKKLDNYLDMLSDDHLRVLIPMLKQEVQIDEAVNPELYNRLAARKGQLSSAKVYSPKPTPKAVTSTTMSAAGPEATKVQQIIGSLPASEKKELLSLLQKEAKTRPAANKKSTQKKSTQPADKKSFGVMKGCLLPLVGIIGLLSLVPNPNNNNTSSTQAVEVDYSNPLDNMKLSDYSWYTDGLTMTVDFEIQNNNPYPVKDIEIKCTHYAESGTEIDSNTRTIYKAIPAKSTRTVKDFNMGFIHNQAANSSCEIISVEKAE